MSINTFLTDFNTVLETSTVAMLPGTSEFLGKFALGTRSSDSLKNDIRGFGFELASAALSIRESGSQIVELGAELTGKLPGVTRPKDFDFDWITTIEAVDSTVSQSKIETRLGGTTSTALGWMQDRLTVLRQHHPDIKFGIVLPERLRPLVERRFPYLDEALGDDMVVRFLDDGFEP